MINSLSGIIGQLTKNQVLEQLLNYWPLLLAVLIGGQIGNFINLKILPTRIFALGSAFFLYKKSVNQLKSAERQAKELGLVSEKVEEVSAQKQSA